MEQRVSFLTLAVADLDATRAFYVDGLGWDADLDVPGEVLMIKVGALLVLSLWAEAEFEAEVGAIRRGPGLAPFTLAHNVATRDEVDAVLGDRLESRSHRPGRAAVKAFASAAPTPRG